MNFRSYMHIERHGTEEVEGIDIGAVYIFPKLDGTNASIWCHNGELYAGSRNRLLTLENDNAGFYAWVLQNKEKLLPYFNQHPTHRLYAEWLVPHTLKTYREDAWRRMWVFDVYNDELNQYLPYDIYNERLAEHGIDFIMPSNIIRNPTEDQLLHLVNSNTFLIQDGAGAGEGITIKNYCVTPDMRVLTADLRWTEAGKLKVGDQLFGFDEENVSRDVGKNLGRKWKKSEIEAIKLEPAMVYELTLSDGTALKSTEEHPWLITIRNIEYTWKKTKDIKPGDRIRRLLPTWEPGNQWEHGYLSGLYDGEGSLVHNQTSIANGTLQVVFNQNSGGVAERVKQTIKDLGFNYQPHLGGNSLTERIVIAGGKKEGLRFLGIIRPERLIQKINIGALGGIKSRNNNELKVISVKCLGEKDIIAMQTSTETYLVEGFGSHNSYINKFGRQTWSKLVRNEFKEANKKAFGLKEQDGKIQIESQIAEKYVTEALVNKTRAKIINEGTTDRRSLIPRLLQTVFHDLVQEEIWNILKEHRNPTIDFGKLNRFVIHCTKNWAKDLF
jgi:hypothetical protein